MGLIKAGIGALGGVLADQWKEFFYCDAIPSDTIAVKGKKRTKHEVVLCAYEHRNNDEHEGNYKLHYNKYQTEPHSTPVSCKVTVQCQCRSERRHVNRRIH